MAYVLHTFRPTETIDAVIRLKGRHNLTKEELKPLLKLFNELNGRIVPRPGMTYKIPLPFETMDDYGNMVPIPVPTFIEDLELEALERAEEASRTDNSSVTTELLPVRPEGQSAAASNTTAASTQDTVGQRQPQTVKSLPESAQHQTLPTSSLGRNPRTARTARVPAAPSSASTPPLPRSSLSRR